jgi:hypothetical protein
MGGIGFYIFFLTRRTRLGISQYEVGLVSNLVPTAVYTVCCQLLSEGPVFAGLASRGLCGRALPREDGDWTG